MSAQQATRATTQPPSLPPPPPPPSAVPSSSSSSSSPAARTAPVVQPGRRGYRAPEVRQETATRVRQLRRHGRRVAHTAERHTRVRHPSGQQQTATRQIAPAHQIIVQAAQDQRRQHRLQQHVKPETAPSPTVSLSPPPK